MKIRGPKVVIMMKMIMLLFLVATPQKPRTGQIDRKTQDRHRNRFIEMNPDRYKEAPGRFGAN